MFVRIVMYIAIAVIMFVGFQFLLGSITVGGTLLGLFIIGGALFCLVAMHRGRGEHSV